MGHVVRLQLGHGAVVKLGFDVDDQIASLVGCSDVDFYMVNGIFEFMAAVGL